MPSSEFRLDVMAQKATDKAISQTHTFRVWAPRAKSVEVSVDGRSWNMAAASGGWWSSLEISVDPQSEYGFCLDGGHPLPDPRSASQPQGVNGLSRLIDHSRFVWHDQSWQGKPLPGEIIYELHIGTFSPSGNFAGAIPHLDHIKSLAANFIQVMPVAEFPGDWGWGYDAVNLYAPHHAYGGPDEFKRFVDACHQREIGVIVDVEYNHLGPGSAFLEKFGPYFRDRQTTWGPSINYDGPHSGEVRNYFIENAEMWLRDYHCDGIRLDAIHAIWDDSVYPIVEEIGDHCRLLEAQLGRVILVLAESDRNDPRLIQNFQPGGFELDAVYADEFHHALHTVLTGEKAGYYQDFGGLELLAKAFRQAWVYTGQYSIFRQRVQGRESSGLNPSRFLVFLQNHDQIGNRATGDRLSDRLNLGRIKVGVALVLLSGFTPMLFQGEEWAANTPFQFFCNYQDPTMQAAIREGRISEFTAFDWNLAEIPDPLDPKTFQHSHLNWNEIKQPAHREVLAWYKTLIKLRQELPSIAALPSSEITTSFDEPKGLFSAQIGKLLIAANLGPLPIEYKLSVTGNLLAASATEIRMLSESLFLLPDSVAILRLNSHP